MMTLLPRPDDGDLAGWWRLALSARAASIAPHRLIWQDAEAPDLFAAAGTERPEDTDNRSSLPPTLTTMIDTLLLHRDPARFTLAYRLLVRIGEIPGLMGNPADPDLRQATMLVGAVRRDLHKMKAFLRFRETGTNAGPRFVAWFEPDHHILRAVAPFFTRRFAAMHWMILTPAARAVWDGRHLVFGPGANRSDAPSQDAMEAAWTAYYAAIFNPARLKPKAMAAEMPKKYWRNLPEARIIPHLIETAASRTGAMIEAHPTRPSRRIIPYVPERNQSRTTELRACTGCALHRTGTHAVAGEGPETAALMIVSGQPEDEDDIAGHPFTGRAGRLVLAGLSRTAIGRDKVYLTHAVKHFKYQADAGHRRAMAPATDEIKACRRWLDAERSRLRPRVIVTLGSTAYQGITGVQPPAGDQRGPAVHLDDETLVIPITDPADLLRLRTEQDKQRGWQTFLDELRRAAAHAGLAGVAPMTLPCPDMRIRSSGKQPADNRTAPDRDRQGMTRNDDRQD